MAWLATVPDGSTVQFGAGRCYGQDGTITLTDRNGLVIDGQGSEFRALTLGGSHRANWRFVGGEQPHRAEHGRSRLEPGGHLQPRDRMAARLLGGGRPGDDALERQGPRDLGRRRRPVAGPAPSPACGDDASSARDVLITGALLERIGRQGVAVVDAERVTLQDSTVGPVAARTWTSRPTRAARSPAHHGGAQLLRGERLGRDRERRRRRRPAGGRRERDRQAPASPPRATPRGLVYEAVPTPFLVRQAWQWAGP